MKKLLLIPLSLFSIIIFLSGCGSADTKSSEEVIFQKQEEANGQITKAELQQDVQRFTGVFLDRISQASIFLAQDNPDKKMTILRQHLLYVSSAVDIGSGESPEANILDMMTFIELSRDRIQNYWKPKVFGASADPWLKAFNDSQLELNAIADKVMSDDLKRSFREAIAQWKLENPDLILVERVRLTQVSSVEGAQARAKSKQMQGVLSSVKKGVAAADEGVLLANRALFLSQHFPFLLRLQTRLGSQEVLSDTLYTMTKADGQLAQMQQELDPLVGDLTVLTREAGNTIKGVEGLMGTFKETFPPDPDSTSGEKLERIHGIVKILQNINSKFQETSLTAKDLLIGTRKQMDSIIWTIALAVFAVGAGIGATWWAGYYLAKRGLKS